MGRRSGRQSWAIACPNRVDVLVSVVLYATGESAATMALRFGARLAGERGEHAMRLAGQAIRGVALGVVVTAFVQALLAGIGLAVVGVPFAVMLTAVMFILAIVQIGVVPVLLCAIAWLYWMGSPRRERCCWCGPCSSLLWIISCDLS